MSQKHPKQTKTSPEQTLNELKQQPTRNYAATQNKIKQGKRRPQTSQKKPKGDLKQAKTVLNEPKQPQTSQ